MIVINWTHIYIYIVPRPLKNKMEKWEKNRFNSPYSIGGGIKNTRSKKTFAITYKKIITLESMYSSKYASKKRVIADILPRDSDILKKKSESKSSEKRFWLQSCSSGKRNFRRKRREKFLPTYMQIRDERNLVTLKNCREKPLEKKSFELHSRRNFRRKRRKIVISGRADRCTMKEM